MGLKFDAKALSAALIKFRAAECRFAFVGAANRTLVDLSGGPDCVGRLAPWPSCSVYSWDFYQHPWAFEAFCISQFENIFQSGEVGCCKPK